VTTAQLAKMIAEHVGFTYEIRPVVDGMYGTKNSSNNWNGIVGELVRQVGGILLPVCLSVDSCSVDSSFSTP